MGSVNLDFLGKAFRGHDGDTQLNDLTSVRSSREWEYLESSREAWQKAAQEKAERERKAAEATIELNNQTKEQNRLLREQVKQLEDQKKAAAAQAKSAKMWNWIMLIVTLISIAIACIK